MIDKALSISVTGVFRPHKTQDPQTIAAIAGYFVKLIKNRWRPIAGIRLKIRRGAVQSNKSEDEENLRDPVEPEFIAGFTR